MTSSDTVAGHVFVSYVREDSSRVDWLGQELEAAGIPVWRDTQQLWPGQDWRAVIRRAIREDALAFLACFSQHSVNQVRTYQNEEIVLAIEEMRLRPPDRPWFFPVRFDDCQIPDRDLGAPRMLSDLQQADLFGDGCEQNKDRLVAAIRRSLSRDPVAPAPSGTNPSRPAAAASSQTPSPKYVINLSNAEGVQIGDGTIQTNTFYK
jgi:hypothetical protein